MRHDDLGRVRFPPNNNVNTSFCLTQGTRSLAAGDWARDEGRILFNLPRLHETEAGANGLLLDLSPFNVAIGFPQSCQQVSQISTDMYEEKDNVGANADVAALRDYYKADLVILVGDFSNEYCALG